VVGLSKLARLTDVFARRLQTQETMTAQIANAIDQHLAPRGVAVLVEAEHMCMSMRGVLKQGSVTVTSQFLGVEFHVPFAVYTWHPQNPTYLYPPSTGAGNSN